MEPPKKKRATYQDVLDAPETKIAEILNGELFLSPRPGGPHTGVGTNVVLELAGPFDRGRGGPGGWIILFEPELHAEDGDVLVPDVGGWQRERMPSVPRGAGFTVVPDFVCEVLSKSTERLDRIKKKRIYAAMGVRYLWLVHPKMRTVEAHRLEAGKWLEIGTYADDVHARIEPFDEVELDVSALWRNLPQPTGASEPSSEWEYERDVVPL